MSWALLTTSCRTNVDVMNNIYFEMRRTLCKRKEAPSGLPGAHRLITRE